MPYPRRSLAILIVVLGVSAAPHARQHAHAADHHQPPDASEIVPNDNRIPAGRLVNGVLELHLRAAAGVWRPEGATGRWVAIEAFGETGRPLAAPAPLIRVRENTDIVASVRNDLPHALRVHGLCERGVSCTPVDVAPSETYEVRFRSGPAGTYTYWATTTGMPQQFRASDDTQLSGAFIVDPADGLPPDDRVLVVTEWTSLTRAQLRELVSHDDPGASFLKLRPDVFFAINGRIWPHTERLRYRLMEPVRWRVVNLSTQVHPMHLHGFYFDVVSLGDGIVDRPFAPGSIPRVVTQILNPGATMSITWTPERAGHWLFHCHVMTHVSPMLHVDGSPKPHGTHHHADDPGIGMTGMVLGVIVDGAPAPDGWDRPAGTVRTLTMEMRTEPGRFGAAPAFAFSLNEFAGRSTEARVPGPTLVLTRGEPVEITLANRLQEATAIHWHGMELESYYDGVHGWGRSGERVTPMIEPGESFVVRFTPPRTGTFMYHTHLHDKRQLTSGLYGAMLVVEPGQDFDERTDHVLVLGRGGPQPNSPVVINDSHEPRYVWKAGATHRVRLINITPDDIVLVTLQQADRPVAWLPLTKDGAPVGAGSEPVAAKQIIGVGETYDFQYTAPAGRRTLWLEVRTLGGRWLAQGMVIVK